jgi:hypothetical protein
VTCWRRREGRSDGSVVDPEAEAEAVVVFDACCGAWSSLSLRGGEEPKMSSSELSAALSVCVEDIVVAGEGDADRAELESVWVWLIVFER